MVIPSTQSTYLPDKLCLLLDDAKELAAQTTLWNLGTVHSFQILFMSYICYLGKGNGPSKTKNTLISRVIWMLKENLFDFRDVRDSKERAWFLLCIVWSVSQHSRHLEPPPPGQSRLSKPGGRNNIVYPGFFFFIPSKTLTLCSECFTIASPFVHKICPNNGLFLLESRKFFTLNSRVSSASRLGSAPSPQQR